MAIKFTDKGPEKPATRAQPAPPPPAPREAKPDAPELQEAETPLPFAKAPRPEKKRRGK